MSEATVHVSIGNSDNRLAQAEWSAYYTAVDQHIRGLATSTDRLGRTYVIMHGRWVSPSTDRYQNACWAFTPQTDIWDGKGGVRENTRERLQEIAGVWRQDTVAWAEAVTEFLPGM